MKNLVAKESIEAVAVKEENIMETQIAVGKEAFSKEVVLRNIAQTDIRLQKLLGYRNYDFYDPKLFMLGLKDGETISEAFSKEVVLRNIAQTDIRLQKLLGYRNYDFYDPKLFMLGLKDGETISEALLRRGAYNIGQVKTRSTRYKNCYTDYFMYPDNESTVVAVVYNNEGVGIPTLLDYEDYAKYFKDENLTLNDRHYFMYPDNESTVVAVVYNNEGVGIPTLLDYEDYAKYFKDENLTLNDRHDNTRIYENPMPIVKIKSKVKVARLVLDIQGVVNGVQADHINCNRFDNRSHNLRAVTNKQNSKNRANSKNVSGDYAYEAKNDYRFGMAILLERYFFKDMSAERASVYNQILLEHFSPISYSVAS